MRILFVASPKMETKLDWANLSPGIDIRFVGGVAGLHHFMVTNGGPNSFDKCIVLPERYLVAIKDENERHSAYLKMLSELKEMIRDSFSMQATTVVCVENKAGGMGVADLLVEVLDNNIAIVELPSIARATFQKLAKNDLITLRKMYPHYDLTSLISEKGKEKIAEEKNGIAFGDLKKQASDAEFDTESGSMSLSLGEDEINKPNDNAEKVDFASTFENSFGSTGFEGGFDDDMGDNFSSGFSAGDEGGGPLTDYIGSGEGDEGGSGDFASLDKPDDESPGDKSVSFADLAAKNQGAGNPSYEQMKNKFNVGSGKLNTLDSNNKPEKPVKPQKKSIFGLGKKNKNDAVEENQTAQTAQDSAKLGSAAESKTQEDAKPKKKPPFFIGKKGDEGKKAKSEQKPVTNNSGARFSINPPVSGNRFGLNLAKEEPEESVVERDIEENNDYVNSDTNFESFDPDSVHNNPQSIDDLVESASGPFGSENAFENTGDLYNTPEPQVDSGDIFDIEDTKPQRQASNRNIDVGAGLAGVKVSNTKQRANYKKLNKKQLAVDSGSLQAQLEPYMKRGGMFVFTGSANSGKTTIAANVANMLCNMGYRVCVLDLDMDGKGLSYINSDTYRIVHSGNQVKNNTLQVLNSTGTDFMKWADVIREGLYMITSTLSSDIDIITEQLKTKDHSYDRLIKQLTLNFNFLIVDVDFLNLVRYYHPFVNTADLIIDVEEATQKGMTNFLLHMANIPNEDIENLLYTRLTLVLNKYDGMKTLFGEKVGSTESMLSVLDNAYERLAQSTSDYSFTDIPVAAILDYSSEYEKYWFSKKYLTDTEEGRQIFTNLLSTALEK